MRLLLYCLVFSVLFICNCKSDEESVPEFTFKGQYIDVINNKVPVGLAVTLQATSSPDLLTKFKKELLGTATTDSMGRFSITYKKTNLPILTLMSQYFTHENLPINKNIDTVFYISNYGTLIFVLTADIPLKNQDTLYLGIPPFKLNQSENIVKLSGPFSPKEIIKFRLILENGGIQHFWAIGRSQWDSVTYFPHKYAGNKLQISMRGDPYADTIRLKYR